MARGGGDEESEVPRREERGVENGERGESTNQLRERNNKGKATNAITEEVQKSEVIHECGKISLPKVPAESSIPILGSESQKEKESREIVEEEMQWEIEMRQPQVLEFNFNMGPNKREGTEVQKTGLGELTQGPMALSNSAKVGWTAESLGPKSGHWKWMARENRSEATKEKSSPTESTSPYELGSVNL